MSEREEQHNVHRGRRGMGLFWLGVLAGGLLTAIIFHKFIFEMLADATGNILPVVFTPGLLEFSIGVSGLGLVIVINYLLRREQRDEWVEIEVEETETGDQ